ncbi:insulinase family protein [Cytophagales bacterium RKSG123]|nr:pitrilysin family protein [Xanthovirga aplysinae]MTI31683.1 insulinase family protein [Xanthovirga aplysinae]
MKYFSLLFVFCLVLIAACTAPEKEKAEGNEKIIPYPIHQNKMENGLNVVTVEYPSPGLASFYIVVRAGSREEIEKGKTGFAHFFEHMMFRGTEKYSKEQYQEILKSIGAAANANTWLDRTVYHMTGNANMLEKMFEIEADRFQFLKYSEHDFKTEAGAVKGEYTKSSASPYSQLREATVNAAFDQHTYKHTTIGFWDDVVDMPNQYDYSLEFFQRFYKPEYATILVVGDVSPETVNSLSEKYFGQWERGSYKAEIPSEPEQTETRFAHVQNANFPAYLSLNYKSPAYNDQDKEVAALDIIATLLFSERSDLYKKLVVEEQKLRSLNGGYFFTRDPYLFSASASFVNEEDMQYVKAEIEKALEEVKTNPVDAKLLAETKSRIKYSFAMDMDSPSNIAEALSYAIWVSGDPESFNQLYDTFQSVTAEDIMNTAKKYFVPEKMTVATISSQEKGGLN